MNSPDYPIGRILRGDADQIAYSYESFNRQVIDDVRLHDGPYPFSMRQTTLEGTASATGPGTFFGSEQRTLTFAPSNAEGWWIDRTDQPEQLATRVSVRNVWTTARNIVLRSGSAHNYLRMVEHIIALRAGLAIDNLTIRTDSGDPPLFDRGNLDLVEAVQRARIVETDQPARFVTVREPVTFGGGGSNFLTLLPAKPGEYGLRVDCAVDFSSAIGQQRILFDVTPDSFAYGAQARTNAPYNLYVYTKTVGKLFADSRNLGYTRQNILIHGKKRYINEAKMPHNGRSLEAVWHRATLDLLAAIALVDLGRFAGTAVSFRAGHTQDVHLATQLYLQDLLVPHD